MRFCPPLNPGFKVFYEVLPLSNPGFKVFYEVLPVSEMTPEESLGLTPPGTSRE